MSNVLKWLNLQGGGELIMDTWLDGQYFKLIDVLMLPKNITFLKLGV